MVHPDALRPQEAGHLAHKGTAATMTNKMNRQLGQGLATQLWNEIGLQQSWNNSGRHVIGAVTVVGKLSPIEFYDNLSGVRIQGSDATNPPLRQKVISPGVFGEVELIATVIGAKGSQALRKPGSHGNNPLVHIPVQT